MCYNVGVSRTIDKTLAVRARKLAEDIWAEAKFYQKWGDIQTARDLNNISTIVHDAAYKIERFHDS